ncbi:MAG TPA: apolipoprotein N-acyltransferase [Thermoanaerobaculia bacterium]
MRPRILHALLAILSGTLFAFSFPGVAQGWLSFIALIPLVVVVVRAGRREAFLLGWLSQTVAWLLMVPWVVRVMALYGGLPVALGVLLFVAMALFLGLYGGLFGIVVHRLRLGERFLPWLCVPLAWAAIEFLRTYMFTGFPWNLLATALVDYPSLIQIDRVAGPYFVAAMMLIPTAVAGWWITQRPPSIARVIVAGATGILLMVWWGTGLIASKFAVRPNAASPVKAALLQPNIAQEMRWDESNVITIFNRMITMTVEAARNGAKVVIWPESTVPLSYTQTSSYRESIERISRDFDVDIILGSVATDPADPNRIWNSAFLASGGTTIGHYDKIRLVPFGEYVPLREMLFFAQKLVRVVGEFEFGTNDKPLRGKLLYGPAICYEIVYPQITRTQIRNGADVLVTITNDAWFDGSSAPAQHLWQARLRAVEGDRYLLRAATTGISAFIDPAGQVVESKPMNVQGIIYAEFQPRKTTTPYVRMGDWFAWFAVVVVLVVLFVRRRATSDER